MNGDALQVKGLSVLFENQAGKIAKHPDIHEYLYIFVPIL